VSEPEGSRTTTVCSKATRLGIADLQRLRARSVSGRYPRARKLHKRLHIHLTLRILQMDLNGKGVTCSPPELTVQAAMFWRSSQVSGDPIGVVPALRADDLLDFLFQQLAQHTQPYPDTQREQPFLRRAHQLPERLLHARRQHDFIHARLRKRYVPVHGGSSLILDGSPRTLPTGADEAGGTAVKFYELRDNLVKPQKIGE
jgi:hypothetical protein